MDLPASKFRESCQAKMEKKIHNRPLPEIPESCSIRSSNKVRRRPRPFQWAPEDDFNLTELINSMKHDIDDEECKRMQCKMAFNEDEIGKLPGYKPKISNMYGVRDKAEVDSSSPPPLPPKKKRCKIQSDGESTRRNHKPHIVNNLLYSRRLPSPPVSKRIKSENLPAAFNANLVRSHDDVSILRQTSFTSLSPRLIANHMTKQTSGADLLPKVSARKLFCPLCIQTFGFGFNLECHLLSVHLEDLESLQTEGLSKIKTFNCPCCRAQFLKGRVMIRHLVYDHPEHILTILYPQGLPNGFGESFVCRFCSQKFKQKHLKLFMLHFEKKHLESLESIFLCQEKQGKSPSAGGSRKKEASRLTLTKWPILSSSPEKGNILRNTLDSSLESDHQFLASSLFPIEPRFNDDDEEETRQKQVNITPSNVSDHDYEIIEDLDIENWEPGDGSGAKSENFLRHKTTFGSMRRSLRAKKRQLKNNQVFFRTPQTTPRKNHLRTKKRPFPTTDGDERRLSGGGEEEEEEDSNERRGEGGKFLFLPTNNLSGGSKQDFQDDERNGKKLDPFFSRTGSARWSLMRKSKKSTTKPSKQNVTTTTGKNNNSNLERIGPQKGSSTSSLQQQRLFKCNLCGVSFLENAFLILHLKNKHNSASEILTDALKPKYCCGQCPAKFFKNRFLLKHVETHQFKLVT